MRKLARLLLVVMLFSALGWVHSAKPELLRFANWQSPKVDPEKLAMLAQAKPSRSFLLSSEQSLSFPMEGQQPDVRLVSTASVADIALVRRQHLANPAKRWDYAIEVEFVDGNGKTLGKRSYHHSANLLEIQRPDGKTMAGAFFLEAQRNPLSTEVTTINLVEYRQAQQMRVKLQPIDADVADVVLRVYQSRPQSGQDTSHRWQRLSPQQQEELARGSVHDKALLSEQEQLNLLKNTRVALGPLGHEGRDYQVRDLYTLFENEGTVQSAPIQPYGVLAEGNLFGMIPLPASGGLLRLELLPSVDLSQSKTAATSQELTLRWYGTDLFQKSSSKITWNGGAQQHQLKYDGGLLEIETPRGVVIRAFLRANEAAAETEITPQPQYERVFLASQQHPVSYAVASSETLSGLRLMLRSFMPNTLRATNARYEAYDAQGKVLGKGQVIVPAKAGHYERVVGDFSAQEAKLAVKNEVASAGVMQLSEPATAFFLLPAQTARFKVWAENADAPLLVVAHSRPYQLTRELHLPEDNFSFDALGKRIPAWFLLHPEEEEKMVANQRSRQLLLQPHPLEETPEQAKILQAAFQWQDYRPHGSWLARPIYTPREPNLPYREDILPTAFTPVAQNKAVTLQFPVYQGITNLSPTLIWLGSKNAKAQHLRILLDGKEFASVAAVGAYGELNLPALAAGKHQFEIKAANGAVAGQFYINHVQPTSASLLRRVAQRFQNEMVFDYDRTSNTAETISARLYQIAGQTNAPKVAVQISGPQAPLLTPLSAWVFNDRIATVRANPQSSKVFDTEGLVADGGNPIFLPFPPDAPRGRYQIRIRLMDGAARNNYLSLSRLTTELAPQSRLHHQPETSHANIIE